MKLAVRGPTSPALMYLAKLGPGSRRAQHQALRVLASHLWPHYSPVEALSEPTLWSTLSPSQCVALRARIAADYAPRTARRILSALRGTVQAAWQSGLLDAETRDRLLDLPAVRGSGPQVGRCLSASEIESLYNCADARDRAILALLLGAGMRRAEAARMQWQNIADAITLEALLHCKTHIMGLQCSSDEPPVIRIEALGKGGRYRTCYIAGRWALDLSAWRLRSADALVLGLTPGGIWKALMRLRVRAGVAPFSPHDLRRTYASRAFAAGVDLVAVQTAMGHADPRTTAAYDRRGADALFRVALATAL